ncbi:NAD(P)/FAD-dependent oxidoreductase [Amycolatopsis sp. YIM 10]|uniref:NAD(P)/FAD-dependent oxidoreductase n=1 Tax=Amycolatopsis sp. YIM 10 TaxID=2653857 RepID=UPI0012907E14|nr:FAD-dependent monooxygenase [Amycolatopsis sp. YIM 10]QFU87511.1 Putative epoxidase LasC [Amycolatopsis sp. YIM 10]
MTRAVVLGGGMAGMLAAAGLARHVDEVIVVEGDALPAEPAPRRGLPQGHHSHLLMAGGAEALDQLLPGTTDRLYAAGAHRRGMPEGMLTLSSAGWYRRHPGDAYVVICSRALTDHVVRRQALDASGNIIVRESAKVVGLAGDADQVTGVRVQVNPAQIETIDADFVVDATGRRSAAPAWLAELGLPEVEEEVVDSGLAYATRMYAAPAGISRDFPAVLIQPLAGTGEPGYGATLYLLEDERWIVTLCGTRGGEPPSDEDGYLRYARNMRHPIIAELVADAQPIGPVRPYRGTINRRRYYERSTMPEGFAVLGDAVAAMNPVYAHGMSVAALGALALHTELDNSGLKPGLAAAVQSAVAGVTDGPWTMACEQDLAFPEVKTNREVTGGPSEEEQRFGQRMAETAVTEALLANALFSAYTLRTSGAEMMTPELQELVERGPVRSPLTAEEAIAQFPELGPLRRPIAAPQP